MPRKLQRNGALPRATGPPMSALIKKKTQAAQETFNPDLASQQMNTKLFFSSQAGKQNLKFWRLHITH